MTGVCGKSARLNVSIFGRNVRWEVGEQGELQLTTRGMGWGFKDNFRQVTYSFQKRTFSSPWTYSWARYLKLKWNFALESNESSNIDRDSLSQKQIKLVSDIHIRWL